MQTTKEASVTKKRKVKDSETPEHLRKTGQDMGKKKKTKEATSLPLQCGGVFDSLRAGGGPFTGESGIFIKMVPAPVAGACLRFAPMRELSDVVRTRVTQGSLQTGACNFELLYSPAGRSAVGTLLAAKVQLPFEAEINRKDAAEASQASVSDVTEGAARRQQHDNCRARTITSEISRDAMKTPGGQAQAASRLEELEAGVQPCIDVEEKLRPSCSGQRSSAIENLLQKAHEVVGSKDAEMIMEAAVEAFELLSAPRRVPSNDSGCSMSEAAVQVLREGHQTNLRSLLLYLLREEERCGWQAQIEGTDRGKAFEACLDAWRQNLEDVDLENVMSADQWKSLARLLGCTGYDDQSRRTYTKRTTKASEGGVIASAVSRAFACSGSES